MKDNKVLVRLICDKRCPLSESTETKKSNFRHSCKNRRIKTVKDFLIGDESGNAVAFALFLLKKHVDL